LSDAERPLSARGKQVARAMGRRLAARGMKPDLIISSPALRARATARRLARQIGYRRGAIVEAPGLYEATLPGLLEFVSGLDDAAARVMLVGHNPSLSLLAGHFWPAAGELPTGAVLRLDLPAKSWAAAVRCAPLALTLDIPRLRPPADVVAC